MRRIAVVTTSRADYGLLKPLMRSIDDDPALSLQLIVSGTHLCPSHGSTMRDIEEDGFHVSMALPVVGH